MYLASGPTKPLDITVDTHISIQQKFSSSLCYLDELHCSFYHGSPKTWHKSLDKLSGSNPKLMTAPRLLVIESLEGYALPLSIDSGLSYLHSIQPPTDIQS